MTIKEWGVTFDPLIEKEGLPAPKFSESMWWRDYLEGGSTVGQRTTINGEVWEFTTTGFQGSDEAGYVVLHAEGQEGTPEQGIQEDVFFINGEGLMTRWDGIECSKGVVTITELRQVLSEQELERAKFALAVASYNSPGLPTEQREHLVLNVEVDGRTIPVEPITTLPNHYHATELKTPSVYFVVKRRRVVL